MSAESEDFEADLAMAERVLERAGGALTIEDIFYLRAAAVWHRIDWELTADREAGVAGRQGAPVVSSEQQRAMNAVGMPSRPKRRQGLGNAYALDPTPVQAVLDKAEVAAGYLYALNGLAADGDAASFMSEGEDLLGPTAIILVWDRIGQDNPDIRLNRNEASWTQASLNDVDDQAS